MNLHQVYIHILVFQYNQFHITPNIEGNPQNLQ